MTETCKIKNVSPYGDLDVPLLGQLVAGGKTVDVSEEHARRLLPQVENWAPVDAAAKKIRTTIDRAIGKDRRGTSPPAAAAKPATARKRASAKAPKKAAASKGAAKSTPAGPADSKGEH